MSQPSLRITDAVVLSRGALRVEVALRPFEVTVRRGNRRILRDFGAWVAEGTVHDQFIQLTEGVVAREDLSEPERARSATVRRRSADGVTLALELSGGRGAVMDVRISEPARITFALEPERAPLRVALDWRRRSDE